MKGRIRYAGKKAVIIGGPIGTGLAMVKALLEGGAEDLLTGRNEKNLAAARRELDPTGIELAVDGDLQQIGVAL
jgi:NAD(P)-dependent dehydrogenase (short-subunit alcohol dehydrogenase family)